MVFDLKNGVPFITERSVAAFWKKAIGEILAFMNGARHIEAIESYGSDFWNDYKGKGVDIGLSPNDMGPGSYGAAFHNFPKPNGETWDQFASLIDQIKTYPGVRTHLITPWIPYYTPRGSDRKVIVAPCHGWLHFRVMNGRLHMRMDQRSADMPIGVPSNMIMYSALLLMVAQVTGYEPGTYVHSFSDAHIYLDQVPAVHELLQRKPFTFPTLYLNKAVQRLEDFRVHDFTLEEYVSHKGMKVPYRP